MQFADTASVAAMQLSTLVPRNDPVPLIWIIFPSTVNSVTEHLKWFRLLRHQLLAVSPVAMPLSCCTFDLESLQFMKQRQRRIQ